MVEIGLLFEEMVKNPVGSLILEVIATGLEARAARSWLYVTPIDCRKFLKAGDFLKNEVTDVGRGSARKDEIGLIKSKEFLVEVPPNTGSGWRTNFCGRLIGRTIG